MADNKKMEQNQIREEEVFAKMILQLYSIDELQDIELSDRPDLIAKLHGGKFGIEVVRSQDPDWKECEELLIRATSQNEELRDKSIAIFAAKTKEKGSEYRDPDLILNHEDTLEDVFDALKKKIAKLNQKKYTHCDSYGLVIVSNAQFGDKQKKHLMKQFVKDNVGDLVFSKIYVITKTRMFECDMDSQNVDTVKIKDRDEIEALTKQYMQTL